MVNRKQSQIKTSFSLVALMAFLSIAPHLDALEEKPWFYSPFNFHFKALFDVSFFTNVNNGYNPIGYQSTIYETTFGFLAPFSPTVEAEIEAQFEKTSKLYFGFESAALQIRRLLLNDIVEDPVSFDLGFNIRAVPMYRLRDVAVPYHDIWNFELNASLGKEFTKEEDWLWRTFLFAAVGQANRGYPWLKANFDLRAKAFKEYIVAMFVRSYFGLGNKTAVNINDFYGWGMYRHQSIDAGVSFTFLLGPKGELNLSYLHRFFARVYPEDFNYFLISYDLPFSF
jgi:hypothetical protein